MTVSLGAAALATSCTALSADHSRARPPNWLKPLLVTVRKHGDAPGVVGLLRGRGSLLSSAVGYADLGRQKPMPATARFRAGSVTKSFTAAVVLELAGEGTLSLDSNVDKWLPGLLPDGARITIRQLLLHTSGLYNYTRDPAVRATWGTDQVPTPRQLVQNAASHGLDFEPGTRWEYSNTNYQVLGLIVEKATGKTLAEEMTRRIVAPLHLSATALDPGRDIRGSHVKGYYVYANQRTVDVTRTTFGAWADGSLVSSVQDLGRFYSGLFAGQLLGPGQLAEMKTTVATAGFAEGGAAGMGIFHTQLRCGLAWTNSGGTAGFLTKVVVSDDGQRVVVIATNGLRDDGVQTQRALDAAAEAAFCHRGGASSGKPAPQQPGVPAKQLRGRIAYSSRKGDLWVMDAAGTNRRRLTHTEGPSEFDPSWSPDGKRLVFRSSSDRDNVSDPNSIGLDRLLVVSRTGGRPKPVNPSTGGMFARWSPDGQWILFTGVSAASDRDTGLFLIRPDGSGLRRIAERGDGGAWSPDSKRISYGWKNADGTYRISVLDPATGDERTIRTSAEPSSPVAWSPNGRSILFARQANGRFAMFTISSDGADEHQVLNTPLTTSPNLWLPNGKIVYGEYKDGDKLPHWYWINADGTGRGALTKLFGATDPIAWWWP